MKTLRSVLLLVLPLAYTSAGCGGSTADESSPDAGHFGTGGAGTGGTTSTSCDVVAATAAQVNICREAVSCVKEQCPTQLSTCLGSRYTSGVYSGMPCSDYATCVKNCNCVSSCSSNCVFSSQCSSCLTSDLLVCVIQSTCAPIAFRCMGDPS